MKLFSRNIVLLFALLKIQVLFSIVQAQDSHFFTGGGFALNFGTITLIDIEPIVGYKFKNNIAIGIGGTYKYYKYKGYYQVNNEYYDLVSNIYGGNVFGRYYFSSESINLLNNIFTHIELEQFRFDYKEYYVQYLQNNAVVSSKNKSIDFTNILVGGGYKQDFGGNSAVNLMVLWNLKDTPYNIYPNPLVKIGFDIGI